MTAIPRVSVEMQSSSQISFMNLDFGGGSMLGLEGRVPRGRRGQGEWGFLRAYVEHTCGATPRGGRADGQECPLDGISAVHYCNPLIPDV